MKEYLVTLTGGSCSTSHIYYMVVTAHSSYEARIGQYEDEEDGELRVVSVQRLIPGLLTAIQYQLFCLQQQ